MRRKQLLIALGMAAAVIACLAAAAFGLDTPPPALPGSADRLAFAARWLLVPALCLLVGIGTVAGRRFFSPADIDGGSARGSLEINLRYNSNTLEQTVLAAVAWTGLALALPQERLGLIPAMAGLFAVGRAAFWIGYLAAPWARAFGMGLTLYPTAAALVWLASRAVA